MKSVGLLLLTLSLSFTLSAQPAVPGNSNAGNSTNTAETAKTAKKRGPVFRATKDQVKQAQAILKERTLYSGEQTGKLDDATRIGLQKYQLVEDLKISGTLNKETLEKMNVPLTDSQKGVPKPPKPETAASADGKKKPPIFRATKDQIQLAQALLKEKGFYSGEANGELNEDTREGLRKYQATNDIKVTGTLNRQTLENMSIQLTEKQKAL
ncbi:MAG TPA: peptidoglycan-binding domain-containing protein [Pyrinomonadaceae bacterium]|jgi:peptidoglycan hydrolase-like protein with peptidoglycan-binding domain|nr:peptidoglycan-binding domain-containing protein [Pyrinomonadaceae bacterium]